MAQGPAQTTQAAVVQAVAQVPVPGQPVGGGPGQDILKGAESALMASLAYVHGPPKCPTADSTPGGAYEVEVPTRAAGGAVVLRRFRRDLDEVPRRP